MSLLTSLLALLDLNEGSPLSFWYRSLYVEGGRNVTAHVTACLAGSEVEGSFCPSGIGPSTSKGAAMSLLTSLLALLDLKEGSLLSFWYCSLCIKGAAMSLLTSLLVLCQKRCLCCWC